MRKQAKNQEKSLVKHTGIYSWLRTGKINPSIRGYKRLQKYLSDIERDLIAEQGGPENMTTAKEVLIKATVQAYGVLLLAGSYTKKYSILRPDSARKGILELQPVLGHQFIAFLNTIRQNLVVLGIEKRQVEEALDLGKYIENKYGKGPERPQDGRSGPGKGQGQGG